MRPAGDRHRHPRPGAGTRDQAVAFFEASTSLPRNEIENEVDRYIAWPGQALAYKIGELKIREIRAKWEKHDGPKFDRRAFHDRLLGYGSVPLDLLERLMMGGMDARH